MNRLNLEPYSMMIKDAAVHFGFHPQTLYGMVSKGELLYGTHYLKVGGKVLIKVEEFKKYLHDKAGISYG